jgi:nucleotide-binding universal stress UspA family protein
MVGSRISSSLLDREVGMFERVVVPLDGSEAAERALPYGFDLAHHSGAGLHLVRVVGTAEVPGTSQGGIESLAAELAAELAMAREYLALVHRRLEERDAAVTTAVLLGDARRQLLAACRQGDILVVASHGHGSHPGVPLGSVVEGVARLARVPLMIVRALPAATRSDARTPEG